MSKPRFDHLIKRPRIYVPADETQQPGYLERRFRAMKTAQRKAEVAPVKTSAKVATIAKRRAA